MKAEGKDKEQKREPVEEEMIPEEPDQEPEVDARAREEAEGMEAETKGKVESKGRDDPEEADSGGEAPSESGKEKAAVESHEDLSRENERLKKELEETEDKHLRLRADFDNFRKRVNKEKANLIQYGNETLLLDLLPVVDNIERVLAHSSQEKGWEAFREGVELVLGEVQNTLSKYGVQKIEALGKTFDPNLHEAMQKVESTEAAPDTVVEEYQGGYLYRDRLLRPSRVMVAVAPQEEKPEASEEEGGSEAVKTDKAEKDQDKDIIQ